MAFRGAEREGSQDGECALQDAAASSRTPRGRIRGESRASVIPALPETNGVVARSVLSIAGRRDGNGRTRALELVHRSIVRATGVHSADRSGRSGPTPTDDGSMTAFDTPDVTSSDLPAEAGLVIVGGGAAGCTLAYRLVAAGVRDVLVIEAGTNTGAEANGVVPGAALARLADPSLSWNDELAPQSALGGRAVPFAQGLGVGGGSSLNLMAWFRGHPEDFRSWEAAGATGWGPADVSKVYAEIESRTPGAPGTMVLSTASDLHPISSAFVLAGRELGLPITDDFNGPQSTGVGLTTSNISRGRRWSVVDAFLQPALRSGHVRLTTGARVDRVVLDGHRATGVEVTLADGTTRHVRAREGVVLAAGAVRTPQILVLSGVGGREELDDLGVATVLDLPEVGQNLSDHPVVYTSWRARSGEGLLTSAGADEALLQAELGRGTLASLTQTGAMLATAPGDGAPDIQMFLARVGLDDHLAPMAEPSVSCVVSLLTPRSRGSVRVISRDPAVAPSIDPRLLGEPEDAVALRQGLRRTEELFQTKVLTAVTDGAISPAAGSSDLALDEWIRDHVYSQWHPVGTARMGSDARAVVVADTMLVNGADRLWVADASVMPTVPRGNTQAPTIMIAASSATRIAAVLAAG
ncbi:GMC family oxidoreductase [Kineococcus sp. GCM10028916]|uniref:GMC family oxidoreductase n=1 Tax=Kineococcus sp. GCM10028916 TaxID=3273394 RepID=UPI0036313C5C